MIISKALDLPNSYFNTLPKCPLDIICNHVFKDVKLKKYELLTLHVSYQTSFDGT